MTTTVPLRLDAMRRRHLVGGEPMVLHDRHYDTYLQRTLLDARYLDSEGILVGAAAEVAYSQLHRLFETERLREVDERKRFAEELYRWAGFGTLDLRPLGEAGGVTETASSHYAMAWKAEFGPTPEPVCHFASGWLSGALSAVYGAPLGAYAVVHTACSADGGTERCRFEAAHGRADYELFQSLGGFLWTTDEPPLEVLEGHVPYEAIYSALTSMEIEGDEQGRIPFFGVYLTWHYASYLNRIRFETMRALGERFGAAGIEAARPLFVRAGHVCAFHTLGGIMTSSQWDALVRPSLRDDADRVHGIVAVVNALGWGHWQVKGVSEEGATFVVHDDYESDGYLALYGPSDHPISYLAEGAAAGILNLVYRARIDEGIEPTPADYDRLFEDGNRYTAMPVRSKAMGDSYTSFRVYRQPA